MSVTIERVDVCHLAELAVAQPALATVNGHRLCVIRTGEREVHCIDDTCTHGAVSLSEGEVDGRTIECWLHGSRFDLCTGRPTGPPATRPVAVYPVTITEDDHVLVDVPTESEK